MNRPDYSISTPENVDLHLELAGIGSRIWAAFVDMALVYLMMLVVVVVALVVAAVIAQVDSETKKTIYYYVIGITILVLFALQFGYFILFEKMWQGQTPGKRLAQIRVIDANGQPVSFSSVVIRNLIRIVDANLMMIGVVVMIFDRNERRLGDLLGGTLVIRERQPELSARNLRLNTEVPESSFVDSGQITPDEYSLLVSFLRRRHQMNPPSRMELAQRLAEYFRAKLSPENKGESHETFLEKVYLAYSARAQENAALEASGQTIETAGGGGIFGKQASAGLSYGAQSPSDSGLSYGAQSPADSGLSYGAQSPAGSGAQAPGGSGLSYGAQAGENGSSSAAALPPASAEPSSDAQPAEGEGQSPGNQETASTTDDTAEDESEAEKPHEKKLSDFIDGKQS